MSLEDLTWKEVEEYLSEETGILVAPTLNYGVDLLCNKGFAGTCSTTKEQGFKRFFFLSGHGVPHHIEALEALEWILDNTL